MEATTQAPVAELAKVRAGLHQAIDEIENLAMLEAIATILDAAQPPALAADVAVRIEDLPPAEREAVEEGIRQLDAGLGIPHAQVWAKYEAKYGVKYPR